MTTAPPPGRYRELLANPSFLRLLSAGIISVGGESVAQVCLLWLVYADTHSALDVGYLGAAAVVAAILFSLIGGTLVDRYDRRRLMILSYAGRVVGMALLVGVLVLRGFDLAVILGVNFWAGALTVVFNPAEQAVIPTYVPAASVADANGLVRSSRSSVSVVGAAAAGVLIVTVGPVAGLAIDGVSWGVGTVIISSLALLPPHAVARATEGFWESLRGGVSWLRRSTGFLQLTLSALVFNFFSSLVGTFFVVYVTVLLHGSALVFASLLALDVAGSALGSLAVGRLGAVRYAGKAWTIPYGIVSGALALVLALVPTTLIALPAVFLLGLAGGFAGTAWLTAAQLLVPTEVQGRYYGIDSLGSAAIIPFAQVGGGILIASFGVGVTYLASAIGWILAGAFFLIPRPLMELGYPPRGVAATVRSGDDGSGRPGSPGGSRAL